jgi:hypothetical protein
VIPLAGAPSSDSLELLRHIEEWARREKHLASGDCIVLVAGVALAAQGHNMVTVHQVS